MTSIEKRIENLLQSRGIGYDISSRIGNLLNYYGIDYKEVGNDYVFFCPFHKETKPSLCLDKDKGIFQCWGCGTRGNLITFISLIENTDKKRAFKRLLQFGIVLSSEYTKKEKWFTPAESYKKDARIDKLIEISRSPNNVKKLIDSEWWQSRRFPSGIVEVFELGYYNNCLVIPIYDDKSQLVSFVLRKLNGEDRYYFPKGFPKKNFVYNLAKCIGHDRIYVVEGVTDVWRMYEAGIPNCIATFGVNVSEEQILLLAKYTYRLMIVFDGDSAGIKGAKHLQDLVRGFMYVKTIFLPEGKDPCDLTASELKEYMGG